MFPERRKLAVPRDDRRFSSTHPKTAGPIPDPHDWSLDPGPPGITQRHRDTEDRGFLSVSPCLRVRAQFSRIRYHMETRKDVDGRRDGPSAHDGRRGLAAQRRDGRRRGERRAGVRRTRGVFAAGGQQRKEDERGVPTWSGV